MRRFQVKSGGRKVKCSHTLRPMRYEHYQYTYTYVAIDSYCSYNSALMLIPGGGCALEESTTVQYC